MKDLKDIEAEYTYGLNKLSLSVEKRLEAFCCRYGKEFDSLVKKQRDFMEKVDANFSEIRKLMKMYDEKFIKYTKVSEEVEQTLMNVFLAIRQNEYLQAYYPPQDGFKEMNVVGTHPLQAKRNL